MLVREERCDENNILYFGDNLITGDNFIDGDEIVIDSVNKSVLEYFYGQDGVMGLVYNGEKYWFRRNIQGDISRIFALDGTIKACYAYDAWGNHIVFDADGNVNTDPDFIGNINPYRYRGYYFDTEMGLYYTPGRYYDPEVGRWINADSIEYLDPESIGGLNLYAYCLNNPIMMTDSTGCKPKWYDSWWGKTLGWIATAGLVVVGAAMIVAVSVGTVATGGLLAAVMVGAGVGILAGVGGSIVAQGGLTNIGDVNPWSVAAAGLVGGVIGGVSGAVSFGFAQIGQAVGQSIGYTLSNARHIGTGLKFAKVFGISTSTLMKAGLVAGGVAGGTAGGMATNYIANMFVTSAFGSQYTVNNPNYIRSGLLKLFQWLNAFA